MATLRSGSCGNYYGSEIGTSEPLSYAEMDVNARYIFSYLSSKGWTLNAICALLGNMQAESSLNPGRWQSEDVNNLSMGYGLVQWTPASKYINWTYDQRIIDYSTMDSNLSRIVYEVENNLQWIATSGYNISFLIFTKSMQPVSELAKAFLLNYERPADQSVSVQNYRAELAEKWYRVLSGEEPVQPDTPSTTKPKKQKYKFLLFNARKRRNTWIK